MLPSIVNRPPAIPPAQTWNSLIASLPGAHILQTWEWAHVKAQYGWEPIFRAWDEEGKQISDFGFRNSKSVSAAALILQRTLPIGGFAARPRMLYTPRGPLLNWENTLLRQQILDDLQTFARQRAAIFIKIDPDLAIGTGIPGQPDAQDFPCGQSVVANLTTRGWLFSGEQVQFRNTVILDLSRSEDELLSCMKQKTRYNIRLAEHRGVSVRTGTHDDLGLLYQMYAETSQRDGFIIRDEKYYRTVWETFIGPRHEGTNADHLLNSGSGNDQTANSPTCEPLIAEVNGEAVAAMIVFRFAGKAWYLYGMSRQAHREKMPNHLLQWEAIRRARDAGCSTYDLWGAPDEFNEDDPLWGVFRFKEGLGGYVSRTLGAWDFTPNLLLYKLYTQTLPRVMDVMRARGKAKTRQILGA